jgi:4-hydroxy-3-methylbut-2-en-1-yl diphosphate reductase
MRILRATHLGMCFGVRNAIEMACEAASLGPLTILGELVHNETVLDELRARGIRLCRDIDDVETPSVMITAHGASERRLAAARGRGLCVLDATCPLVRAAHRAVARLVRDGFHPVIVGTRDHVEVQGLTEDLADFDVVRSEEDVAGLASRRRFGIAAQTTQPLDRVHELAALVERRFPGSEVQLVDTVCAPTKLRQRAAVDLAGRCDVTIVIGGAHSNNTRELAATCRRHCARVVHVQGADDLQAEWFDDVRVAGITAGTSTPESVVDNVQTRLKDLVKGRVAA